MQDAKELLPLMQYQMQWLIIGGMLIAIVIAWFVFIFWSTRHKRPKTVATLKAKTVISVDIAALKRKYLGLIDEVQQAATTGQINNRQVHQKLSLLVRLFAFEASGFRAHVMTLTDLQRGRFPKLKEVIATYYPNEFGILLQGTTDEALAKAREVVATWQ
jgi:hypothetical protein